MEESSELESMAPQANSELLPNGLRYSQAEIAQRGREIYESRVRPEVEADNKGMIVAIDIETGDFEVGKDSLTASDVLLERCPHAQIWFVRIGYRAVHRIGHFQATESR